MNHRKFALLSTAGLLALAAACSSAPNSVKTTTESTTRVAGGSVKTTSETKEVGTTLVGTSETKADTRYGTSKSKTETVVGTVTSYTAGKRIEVMTGDKNMHSFDLNDKDITYSVDGYVAVGERVTVIEEKGDDKLHRITVKLGG
ncbi:MAG: hypothetical protein ACYDBY_02915 [Thermoanaerobaculia bacterium]